jgi:hypothetical protein
MTNTNREEWQAVVKELRHLAALLYNGGTPAPQQSGLDVDAAATLIENQGREIAEWRDGCIERDRMLEERSRLLLDTEDKFEATKQAAGERVTELESLIENQGRERERYREALTGTIELLDSLSEEGAPLRSLAKYRAARAVLQSPTQAPLQGATK